jgi:L-fuconolactonase
LAHRFPQQAFCWTIWRSLILKGRFFREKGIRALADYPNVSCKVSGMVTEADWKTGRQMTLLLPDVVTEAFGINRLMFGSDWPCVCWQHRTRK